MSDELKACPWGCAPERHHSQPDVVRCIRHTAWMSVDKWNLRAITPDVERTMREAALAAIEEYQAGMDEGEIGSLPMRECCAKHVIAAVKARRGGKL